MILIAMVKKKLGVLISKIDGVYYASYEYEVYELNEVGARVLDLCNGKNTNEDIINKISGFYQHDKELISQDVSQYIDQLLSMDLIASC